jgi:hypothetical protein
VGWKTINGRRYLYRSVRAGGRVRSEYIGKGEVAELIARKEAVERDRREWERYKDREEREEVDRVERAMDDLVADARRAAADALSAAGYHRHHRCEWRKRRVN